MFGKSGSILISIGNLPPRVSRKALKAHIRSVIDGLRGTGFRLTPAICSCSILRLTDPAAGVTTHQGLVSVQPPKLAFQVMEALERAPLRGLNLDVSRFRHGSFPVNSSTRLTSMSDLLGVGTKGSNGRRAPLQLDLVTDTGLHKPTGAPSGATTQSSAGTGGILAH